MRRNNFYIVVLFVLLSLQCLRVLAHYPHVPDAQLSFMENKGQTDARAAYYLHLRYAQYYIEPTGFQYLFFNRKQMDAALAHPVSFASHVAHKNIDGHAVRMEFLGSKGAKLLASGQQPGVHHFYLGKTANGWSTNCKKYNRVHMQGLYDGIDAAIYTTAEGVVKYDFLIAPQVNAGIIKLKYHGANNVEIRTDGSLAIITPVTELRELAPFAYQIIGGERVVVACQFAIDSADGSVYFQLGAYDHDRQLVIDPEVIFSTYSGSTSDNFGSTATYDANGNFYSGGLTTGPLSGYPTTAGAFSLTYNGGEESWPQMSFSCDITISKYNNDGTQLIYATYLGGNKNDYVHSLVANAAGELTVLGSTLSTNYPVTPNAFDTTYNDTFEIVVTRFNASGTALLGSTYVGGSGIDGINALDTLCMNYMDQMRGEVQHTSNGDIIVASVSSSANFPVTSGSIQTTYAGNQDGVVFRMNANLSQMVFSTYFGQTGKETLNGLEVEDNGDILLVGGTNSINHLIRGPVHDSAYRGGIADGWIARISGTGDSIKRFMYTGTQAYDQVFAVRTDRWQNVYILGQTFGLMPTTNGVYKRDSGSLFIASYTQGLDSLRFRTTIGNGILNNTLVPSAFMVDYCGAIYTSVWAGSVNALATYRTGAFLTGASSTTNGLTTTNGALQTFTDGQDFYLFVLNPLADSLLYATYLGEIFEGDHVDGGTSRFDARGIIYQSICASCNNGLFGIFPTTSNAMYTSNLSPRCSNASLKMDFRVSDIVTADFMISPRRRCNDSVITFTNNSFNANSFRWIINDTLWADTSTDLQWLFSTPGIYRVKLIAIDSTTCNVTDSITKTVRIGTAITGQFFTERDTCSEYLFFRNLSLSATGDTLPVLWDFGDGTTSREFSPKKIFNVSDNYPVILYIIDSLGCGDTVFQFVDYNRRIHLLEPMLSFVDTLVCEPYRFWIFSFGWGGQFFEWYINDTLVSNDRNLDTTLTRGEYFFKQIVYDSATCLKVDSVFSYSKVLPDVTADFEMLRDSCSLTINFINTSNLPESDSVSFVWTFGNGDSAFSRNVSYTFDSAATYLITLTVNAGLWCEDSHSKSITLDNNNQVLSANFTVLNQPICVGDSVVFANVSINGIRWQWYLNGELMDSTIDWGQRFDSVGTYEVKLVLFDTTTCFAADSFIQQLTVNPSSRAAFSWWRDTCSAEVIFKNLSDTFTIMPVFEWDFGDGNKTTQFEQNHLFDANGTYTVWLYTNRGTPCADSVSQVIVYDSAVHLLVADFEILDSVGCAPFDISTTNNSVNNSYNFWYVNDTLATTSIVFDTTFSSEGSYTIMLIVVDSATCLQADTFVRTVILSPSSQADFELQRDSCSLEVTLKNKSKGVKESTRFFWDFGNGDTSDLFEPTYTFKSADNYTITLITHKGSACADTVEKVYFIDGDTSLHVFVPNVFTPNGDGVNDCFGVEGVNEKCDEFEIWVRNRWGNEMYHSTNPSACWDGNNAFGKPVTDGVYFYMLYIKKKDGRLYQTNGTVSIIR